MISFAARNCKIFFRQKSTVFFSLLGVFIVIGLYLLFLGDVWISNFPNTPEIKNLMNHWIVAGLVSITPITTTMGAFSIMVEDRSNRISRDFFSSPARRSTLVGGYVLSACLVGFLLSLLTFLLGEVYLVCTGGSLLSLSAMGNMLLYIVLSSLSSGALVFFIVSFFSKNSAFSTGSSIIGTLIGFLTGIYLPIGSLPEGVQWAVKLFPPSHAGALMRQVMVEAPQKVSFPGAAPEDMAVFRTMMGVDFTFGDVTLQAWQHIVILLASGILFFALAIWNVSRKKKTN